MSIRRVAYIVNAFPVISETFLVNEIRGIEREGIPVTIVPLTDRADELRPDGTESIAAEVLRRERLLPFGWARYLGAHAVALASRPGAYLRLVRDDLCLPWLRFLMASPGGRSFSGLAKRWRLFSRAPLIARQSRSAGVGLLHAHYAKEPLEIAARASWLSGIPYSFAAHAKDLYTSPPDRLARRLSKAKFALSCHPHGHRTLRALASEECVRERIHLIPHGLDLEVFSPGDPRREPGLIVAVGRLTPKKGFDVLIEACSRLRQDLEYRCVILGAGRLRDRLERLIQKRGLADRVSIRGFVGQRELASWYRRAQVVAVPGRVLLDGNRDGIPNVMLEAMACGAPIVATPVGSIGEFIEDGITGRLVPPEDPKALAAAIEKSLTMTHKASKMAARARARVENLDFKDSGKEIAKLIRRRLSLQASPQVEQLSGAASDWELFAKSAYRKLGRQPRYRPDTEIAIARSIAPGLAANAWRSDLESMASRRLWDEVAKAPRAAELVRFTRARGLELSPSARVLDVGCGRGGVSVALMARGIRVVSVDLRPRNCHVTRLRGERYDSRLPVAGASSESLPFENGLFDIVCLFELLEHVRDPVGTMREARRVCSPTGFTVVTVVNRWAHLDPHFRLWGINFLPRSVAERLLDALGRSKRSWQDNQRLADMHYYSYSAFERFANQVGFEVCDPNLPDTRWGLRTHRLARAMSIGFNTVTLVLEPS